MLFSSKLITQLVYQSDRQAQRGKVENETVGH